MSAIPSSAMPHTFADEDVDLRDPHGGHLDDGADAPALPTGLLIAGAAVLGYALYRLIR